MKRVTVTLGLVLLVGGSGSGVLAAELEGFFSCHEIVFFEPCPKTASSAAAQPYMPAQPQKEAPDGAEPAQKAVTRESSNPAQVDESIWAEPVRGPDGQFRVYLPPRPVRDFLEKPTPENARAYLAWNLARMRRMDEAVNVMRDVAAQQFGIATQGPTTVPGAPPASDAAVGGAGSQFLSPPLLSPSRPETTRVQGPAPANTAARQISMVYAFATWCPYSRQQTPIINQFASRVPVRGIAFESKAEDVQALRPAVAFPVERGDAELRQRLGVRSYPTIFFYEGSRLLHVARGLQPPARLVTVLA
ncbi:MAG: thioredoxin fold domain-containing protein, partial [Candidatus Rokuibacteriota bacterium]